MAKRVDGVRVDCVQWICPHCGCQGVDKLSFLETSKGYSYCDNCSGVFVITVPAGEGPGVG